MRTIEKLNTLGLLLSLQLLCSCVTTPSPPPTVPLSELPGDVVINQAAGRGGHLVIMLRLGSGPEMPFIVDTGSPVTVVEKSQEPQLGKRLGMTTITLPDNRQTSGVYAAPMLFIGSTLLRSDSYIYSYDFSYRSSNSFRSIMGILGMDCLKHYCVQLDFEARTMRFLDPSHLDNGELGKSFPLTMKRNCPLIRCGRLFGDGADVMIDTGCNIDGLVAKAETEFGGVYLQECVWDGGVYTDLVLGEYTPALGLRFLARHLVTLNFPQQKMYLKRKSVGALDDKDLNEAAHLSAPMSALQFLKRLREERQLPGWDRDDKAPVYYEAKPNTDSKSVTFTFGTKGTSSVWRYEVTRSTNETAWTLQRSWSTNRK